MTHAPATTTGTSPRPQPDVARGVHGTRTGALWTLVSLSVLVAIIAIIFMVQNSQRTKVSFLGWDGHVSLFVLLLCATVLGALLVLFVGMARIVQLRVAARRQRGRGRADESAR